MKSTKEAMGLVLEIFLAFQGTLRVSFIETKLNGSCINQYCISGKSQRSYLMANCLGGGELGSRSGLHSYDHHAGYYIKGSQCLIRFPQFWAGDKHRTFMKPFLGSYSWLVEFGFVGGL